MRNLIFVFIALLMATVAVHAQNDKEKSETKSALVAAQDTVMANLVKKIFDQDAAIDHDKAYIKAMEVEIARCLLSDLALWGEKVKSDADEGKYQKFRLSFEKSDSKFNIPGKAVRNYEKAFNQLKKDFLEKRKTKSLEEIGSDKYLQKYIKRVVKALYEQKKTLFRQLTK